MRDLCRAPRRHGHRPDPGPSPSRQVLVAPRPDVARRATTGPSSTRRGSRPSVSTTPGADGDVRALPGHRRPPARPRVDAIDADLAAWFDREPFADAVARLAAYRGITELGALAMASEVCDWRRFPTPAMFMGFCGLVPSEHSSGRPHPPRRHHPRRQHPPAHPARRVRLGLQVPPPGRHRPRADATKASTPTSSPEPGPRSCACAASSAASTNARPTARPSSPPSPASSPGSCGPR